jgi:hypothetical protein
MFNLQMRNGGNVSEKLLDGDLTFAPARKIGNRQLKIIN